MKLEIDKYFEKRIVDALIAYYTKTYLDKKPPESIDSTQRGPEIPC
jgi:hypothetical protein